ncbi:hypothetical protein LSPH24S_08808 [Lysinibacillus sphaericus]
MGEDEDYNYAFIVKQSVTIEKENNLSFVKK